MINGFVIAMFYCVGNESFVLNLLKKLRISKNDLNNYLCGLENSHIRSLKEIVHETCNMQMKRCLQIKYVLQGSIKWKHANCTVQYPSQPILERAITEKFPAERIQKLVNYIKIVRPSFEDMRDRYGLDFILAPGILIWACFLQLWIALPPVYRWSELYSLYNCWLACLTGIPIATSPLAYLLYNGRPSIPPSCCSSQSRNKIDQVDECFWG